MAKKFLAKCFWGWHKRLTAAKQKCFALSTLSGKARMLLRRHKSKASGRERQRLEKLKPSKRLLKTGWITKENYFCHFLRIFLFAERQSGDAAMDSVTRGRQISYYTPAIEDFRFASLNRDVLFFFSCHFDYRSISKSSRCFFNYRHLLQSSFESEHLKLYIRMALSVCC